MVTPDGSIISLERARDARGEHDSPRLAAWQMAFDVSSAYICIYILDLGYNSGKNLGCVCFDMIIGLLCIGAEVIFELILKAFVDLISKCI